MKNTLSIIIFSLLAINVFSQESKISDYNIEKTVYYLASEELQGRFPSTQGDSLAVDYISSIYKQANLKPLFENYFQEVSFKDMGSIAMNSKQAGPKNKFSRNIVGVLEGSDSILKNEYIVIGAHYDHLGLGSLFGVSRSKESNQVHYGADDNASGVALMLDLLKKFSTSTIKPKRSIIFVAFACEEEGLIGSKKFVEDLPFSSKQIVAMFNFDMVGKLKNNSINVGGSKTSKESEKIIKKYAKRYNLKASLSPSGIAPSDHASFYAKNITVFYFTTGADSTYHTHYDTPERLNYKGMDIVSLFAYDIASDVANRNSKLRFNRVAENNNKGHMSDVKITLGIMPDVTGSTDGLKAENVSKGKPADKAGMQTGDIIIELNGKKVTDIYTYMDALATLKENNTYKVKVKREGKTIELKIKL